MNLDDHPITDTYHIRALRLLNTTKREVGELLALMLEGDIDPADPAFGILAQFEADVTTRVQEMVRTVPGDGTTGPH